ncbi:MAG: molybdenum cofactor guanylyltransferase MobA [Panacagrimonas sp.]
MIAPVSAGILAGGQGARFGGQDKGWVPFRGRPMIEWTLDALRPQASEILISANRNLDRYAQLGARLVPDATDAPYQGPFAGLVRLLENANHEWLLCVPCDAVILPPDLAERFAQCLAAAHADLAVLADSDGIHPTFCFVRAALAADARRCFDDGERAPRRWLARHRVAHLRGPSPINLNTPEGLAAVELCDEPAARP